MRYLFVLLIFICLAEAQPLYAQQTLYGDTSAFGNGIIYPWVSYNNQGIRDYIGVSISQEALNGMPAGQTNLSVLLPVMGTDTLFNHVFLNWNPQGHPPGVWTLPHFDVHFMMVSEAERMAVVGGIDSTVPAPYIPQDYIKETEAVPLMGSHWVDSTTPEFHGYPFTHNILYGFYRHKMFFVEPMITKAYLLTNPTDTIIIKQPTQYLRTGYFPIKYTLRYDAANQKYDIVIHDFVFRIGGPISVKITETQIPENFTLYQNYPNPFNPKTNIKFDIPNQSFVKLTIFNSLGQEVIRLVNENLNAGSYEIDWNGDIYTSGIYFYTLQAGDHIETRKMILIK